MKYVWKTLPKCWNHGIRLVVLTALLCLSACAAPGHSISTSSPLPPERGSRDMGNGGGGY